MQFPERTAILIFKQMRQGLTHAEQIELDNWINASRANREHYRELLDPAKIREFMQDIKPIDQRNWEKVVAMLPELSNRPRVEPPDPDGSRRIAWLISNYILENISVKEEEELQQWIDLRPENQSLFRWMTEERSIDRTLEWLAEQERRLGVDPGYPEVVRLFERPKPEKKPMSLWIAFLIGLAVTALLMYLTVLSKRH